MFDLFGLLSTYTSELLLNVPPIFLRNSRRGSFSFEQSTSTWTTVLLCSAFAFVVVLMVV